MSFPRGQTAAFAVVVLVAVGSVDTCRTGPGEPGAPQVEFTVLGALEAGKDAAVRVDSVSSGQVVLRGGIGTPTPCYTIRAELAQRESTLTLTLVATVQPVVCITVLAAFEYRARIYGVSAGRYTVEVVATYPGTGWTPRADTLQVEIP
ncbi:MAG: hypothetical protein HYV20_00025 [Gemmatimonadetes bacterium]|nr:hypothetical protein [Gemmatimonadota bacterium]